MKRDDLTRPLKRLNTVRAGRVESVKQYTCPQCRDGKCESCLDVLRSAYASDRLCHCKKQQHAEHVK